MNSNMDPVKTGQNIKKYRKRKGLSVREVSKKLNLNATQSVYKWERGQNVPRVDNLFALCYILEVSPMDICVFYDENYAKKIHQVLQKVVDRNDLKEGGKLVL